jgi:hypothetical protein
MKKLILLSTAFLASVSLFSQTAKPVVLVSTTGKVTLKSEGKRKASPIEAGGVAKNTGTLLLSPGAKAVVYCSGQFKEVSGAKSQDLSSICGNEAGTQRVDADYDFGEKLVAAVEMVAVAKHNGHGWSSGITNPRKGGDGWGTAIINPRKGGDGWGSSIINPRKGGDGWGTAIINPRKGGDGWGSTVINPRKGGDGWGGKGSTIRLIMPFGKLKAGTVNFIWSKPKTSEPYELSIKDEAGKTVHTQMVRDTFVALNLNSLNLAPEQLYRWTVSVAGANPMQSDEMLFGIATEDDWKETMEQINSSSLAKTSNSPALSKLVEAVALEQGEWYYDAYMSYQQAQKQQPDNLVRMMHAAFLTRYGFYALAEKAVK